MVLLASLPISALALSLAVQPLEPAVKAQREHLRVASKHAVASVVAIDIVKISNGYNEDVWKYSVAIKRAARHYLIQARSNAIQVGYTNFWVVMLFVTGFWYGVVLVNDGVQPGSVLTAFFAILASFQGIEALMPQWIVLARGMLAGTSLSDLTHHCQLDHLTTAKLSIKPQHCVGTIELTDVSLYYLSPC